uniref:Ubiquitin carboxyl-terminal hydrolase MINDY n=2 Tax=Cacopsylla melanoneura TaxID=428564 RepID=A0A8D9AMJ4_9HEMI
MASSLPSQPACICHRFTSYDPYKTLPRDRVMYARSQQLAMSRLPVLGGTPITQELAIALRTVVFGSSITPIRGEWAHTAFTFREPETSLAYGMKCPRNGTRGLLTAVQAYVLKNLLFPKQQVVPGVQPVQQTTVSPDVLLKPSRHKQLEALYLSLSDILWRVGERVKVTLALPSENIYVPHSLQYFTDTITEKLMLFEVSDIDELQILIKRYVYLFVEDNGPGALLLLYSAVITRGIDRTLADFQTEVNTHLVCGVPDEGSLCIVMLLLSGRATCHLHNGIVYVGDEEHYAIPQYGVLTRNEIGFLIYEESRDEKVPGSRLKTPSVPIWVTCSTGHYGVMFNTNRELLRNYHAERRFDLIHYSLGGSETAMTIDTRQENIASSDKSAMEQEVVPTNVANIEKIIHTKWNDAQLTWNGTINSL